MRNEHAIAKAPKQARGKKRVKTILKAALRLVDKNGISALKMNAIAIQAKVPIGSVYQYFPTKSTLISALAKEYNTRLENTAYARIQEVKTKADLIKFLKTTVQEIYRQVRKDRFIIDIEAGVLADRVIREIRREDNEIFTEILFQKAKEIITEIPPARLRNTICVLNEMIDSTIRLSSLQEDEKTGNDLVSTALDIVIDQLLLKKR